MKYPTFLLSCTLLGCSMTGGSSRNGVEVIGEDAGPAGLGATADASPVQDAATLGADGAAADAAPVDPDASYVEQLCPGEECGGGMVTFCGYEHLGNHNQRETRCGNPEHNVGGSASCGECPADPVCVDSCAGSNGTSGFTMCDDDPYESRPRATVCRTKQPVWGDGFSCGTCAPPTFSIQAQNSAVVTPPNTTTPVTFFVNSLHHYEAEVPIRAYVTLQNGGPSWEVSIEGTNPPSDRMNAHVGPDNPNEVLTVRVNVTTTGVQPVAGTAVYLVHDVLGGTEQAATPVMYGNPEDF